MRHNDITPGGGGLAGVFFGHQRSVSSHIDCPKNCTHCHRRCWPFPARSWRAVASSAGGDGGRKLPEYLRAIRVLLLRHPR
jgi:hypothetical protein